MINEAQKKNLTDEKKMWQSIDAMGGMLEMLKESHPEMYWKLMREQHRILFNGHYSEEFAQNDVDSLRYTDKDGKEHTGGHWTKDQVTAATQGKTFPAGVTECDKYVAYNAMYADLCKKFDDAQILDAAYLFYFADEEWPKPATKVWDYMCLAHK